MGFETDTTSQMERTLLELGTEVYRLKNELSELKGFQENFIDVVNGLKFILDDKGLITVEDFDSAIELGDAISFTHRASLEDAITDDIKKIKKTSH